MTAPTYAELETALNFRDCELAQLESKIKELEKLLRQRETDLTVTIGIMNSLTEG